ncbi:hypothetical protein BLOT_014047 [Blomia tropicalis]|nr:hypothetical protein BLOT_014047 [Blomia tropicalis]
MSLLNQYNVFLKKSNTTPSKLLTLKQVSEISSIYPCTKSETTNSKNNYFDSAMSWCGNKFNDLLLQSIEF